MQIIAFGHKRRVGKDTASRLLLSHFRLSKPKLKVQRRSFAAKLKETAADLYGWAGVKSGQYYENNPSMRYNILPALGMHVVDLWIRLGNDLREVHSETWIQCLFSNCDADIIILSDLRYPNEAAFLRSKGDATLIRIDRPDAPVSDDVADNALNDWTDWDFKINNTGTLKEYSQNIEEMMKTL